MDGSAPSATGLMRKTKKELVAKLLAAQKRISDFEARPAPATGEPANRFELVLQGGDLGYWDVNFKTKQSSVNDRWSEILGYSPGEIDDNQQVWRDTLHPDDRDKVLDIGRRYRKGELEHYVAEYRAITKRGDTVWLLTKGFAVERNGKGEAVRMVGTVMDVTERKNIEMELARQKALLEAALENVDQGIMLYDHEMRALIWNKRYVDLRKLPDELMSTRPTMHETYRYLMEQGLYPKPEGNVEEHIRDRVDRITGRDASTVFEQTMPDGTILEARGKRIPGGGFVRSFTDITERKRAEHALRESETRLRSLMDNSPTYIYLKDTEGRYLVVNKFVEDVMGLSSDEIVGKTQFDIYPHELAERYREHDREVVRTKKPVMREFEIPTADGRIRQALINKFPIFDENGEVEAIGAVNLDVTERIEAERDALEKKRILELILENMAQGLTMYDGNWNLVTHNANYMKHFDLPPEIITEDATFDDVVGATMRLDYGDEAPERLKVVKDPGRMHNIWRREFARPSGRHLDVVSIPIPAGGFVVTSTDITDRVTTERILAEKEAQLSVALTEMSDGIFVLDEEGRYAMFNHRYFELSGLDPDFVKVGTPILDVIRHSAQKGFYGPGDAEQAARERYAELMSDAYVERETKPPNGRTLHVRKSPLEGGGSVTMLTDVTERNTYQEELRAAKEEAEALSQSKSDFVAVVSHEVRTPMNGVLGMAHLLQDMIEDGEARECVDAIVHSGRELLSIVDDLLDISKLEAGRLELESAAFHLEDVVSYAVAIMRPRAAIKDLSIDFTVDEKIPPVLIGDPHRLRQILLNLLSNAIKFTDHGSINVEVACRKTSRDRAEISFDVIDTGHGISDNLRESLFDAYVQASIEISRRQGGTGLGLSICRHLVQLMGGTIALESEVGKGSTFTFLAKFGIDRETDLESVRRIRRKSRTAGPRMTPERVLRILQVEDNATNRDVVDKTLTRAGHQVVNVVNGVEALEALQEAEFDAVIMDRHMPGMDGLEATRRIRKLETPLADIPIVGLTAGATKREIDSCLDAGMNRVVIKPFEENDLLALLDKLTTPDKRAEALTIDGPVLVVDDAQINLMVINKQLKKVGVACDLADSGEKALELFKTGKYAALLVDVVMPEMNGLDLTRRIRRLEEETSERILIIGVSGRTSAEQKAECFESGMDEFLAKPLTTESLMDCLGRWFPTVQGRVNDRAAPDTTGDRSDGEPPIDLAVLYELIEEDEAGLYAHVRTFLEFVAPYLDDIDAGRQERDAGKVEDAAHAAKSAAGATGATVLWQLLDELENSAIAGDWEGIEVQSPSVQRERERIRAFTEAGEMGGEA